MESGEGGGGGRLRCRALPPPPRAHPAARPAGGSPSASSAPAGRPPPGPAAPAAARRPPRSPRLPWAPLPLLPPPPPPGARRGRAYSPRAGGRLTGCQRSPTAAARGARLLLLRRHLGTRRHRAAGAGGRMRARLSLRYSRAPRHRPPEPSPLDPPSPRRRLVRAALGAGSRRRAPPSAPRRGRRGHASPALRGTCRGRLRRLISMRGPAPRPSRRALRHRQLLLKAAGGADRARAWAAEERRPPRGGRACAEARAPPPPISPRATVSGCGDGVAAVRSSLALVSVGRWGAASQQWLPWGRAVPPADRSLNIPRLEPGIAVPTRPGFNLSLPYIAVQPPRAPYSVSSREGPRPPLAVRAGPASYSSGRDPCWDLSS